MTHRSRGGTMVETVRAAVCVVVALIAATTSAAATGGASCVLIAPEQPTPLIVVGQASSDPERFAAQELAEHLEAITGKKITVIEDNAVPAGARLIAVGRSTLTESYDVSSLGPEQYIIDATPDQLVIVGGRGETRIDAAGNEYINDRGTLYGVYHFLEDLGVRWYRPEPWGWHIPKMDTVERPLGRFTSEPPAFFARAPLSGSAHQQYMSMVPSGKKHGSNWAARMRINMSAPVDGERGGQVRYQMAHAHDRFIPASKYLESHPEFFALVNGQRGRSRSKPQLCYSNPELQKEFARNLIRYARENPHLLSIGIDPNDGTSAANMCQCDGCKKMDDPKNPSLMTNRVVAFTNLMARALAKAVPDAPPVLLYAYSSHIQPPTLPIRLEPNVMVMPCPINQWSDWTKKLFDRRSQHNQRFVEVLDDWKRRSTHPMFVYEYGLYGWLGPMPQYRILQDRVQSYRKMNVKGFRWISASNNFGPQGLYLYMLSQLMWNPDLDLAKELDLYYENYYGPAAKPMKAYHETWMDAFEQSDIGGGQLGGGINSGGRGMHMICTPALMAKLGEYIQEAEQLVKGDKLYERRFRGTWIGYEFSRRVSELLAAKAEDGVLTETGRGGYYLKSAKAAEKWEDLKRWIAQVNQGDAHFGIKIEDGQPQDAALVYMVRDLKIDIGSGFSSFAQWNEETMLRERGFFN